MVLGTCWAIASHMAKLGSRLWTIAGSGSGMLGSEKCGTCLFGLILFWIFFVGLVGIGHWNFVYIYINDLILTRCLTVVPQKCVSRVSNSHKKLSPGDILEGET